MGALVAVLNGIRLRTRLAVGLPLLPSPRLRVRLRGLLQRRWGCRRSTIFWLGGGCGG